MDKNFAVIVAGGQGTRMQQEVPKQFITLASKPILVHTLEAFQAFDPDMELIVALPGEHFTTWFRILDKFPHLKKCRNVKGGFTRFHSVKNALQTLDSSGWVCVHDAVRMLVSPALIAMGFKLAREWGSAIPIVPVKDSIRFIDESQNHPVERSKLFRVQTPQTFSLEKLKLAYQSEYSDLFTDDASVMEQQGNPLHYFEGEEINFKITVPEDIQLAEALMMYRTPFPPG